MADRPSTARELAIEYLKLYPDQNQPTPEEFADKFRDVYQRIEKALADNAPTATTWKY